MELTQNYKNAFTEVYEILNLLDEEEYKKIPQNIVSVIENNRNIEYKYEIDRKISLSNLPMLVETKAILFNLFRDYLSTPTQKQKIIEMQREERVIEDKKKRKIYNPDDIFKIKQDKVENILEEKDLVKIKKERFFNKIINKLKKVFGKNKSK